MKDVVRTIRINDEVPVGYVVVARLPRSDAKIIARKDSGYTVNAN